MRERISELLTKKPLEIRCPKKSKISLSQNIKVPMKNLHY